MDDETYVTVDFKQIHGAEFYTAMKRGAPGAFKLQMLDKFPKKYLVWLAIRQWGMKSKSFITTGT